MANYEIQNHLGEVLSIVSSDELDALIEAGELNYAQHDDNVENDMVKRLAQAKADDPELKLEMFRIYKPVVEEEV